MCMLYTFSAASGGDFAVINLEIHDKVPFITVDASKL
jgi:hypothetical protein